MLQTFENILKKTTDYRMGDAIAVVDRLLESRGCKVLSQGEIDVLQIAFDIPKVRRITGKRNPQSARINRAQELLYMHSAGREKVEVTGKGVRI